MKRTARWQCHHCEATVKAGEEHDCWTTTEAALTQDLSDDLRDAWERIRETAVAFGEQRDCLEEAYEFSHARSARDTKHVTSTAKRRSSRKRPKAAS